MNAGMVETVNDLLRLVNAETGGNIDPEQPLEFYTATGQRLKVTDVYTDEGVLCIDLERHETTT